MVFYPGRIDAEKFVDFLFAVWYFTGYNRKDAKQDVRILDFAWHIPDFRCGILPEKWKSEVRLTVWYFTGGGRFPDFTFPQGKSVRSVVLCLDDQILRSKELESSG